jgi:AraC-like DNA-binding protein
MSITDIALEVGYSDTAYFCTLFKKEVGVSPARYRKNIVKGKRA